MAGWLWLMVAAALAQDDSKPQGPEDIVLPYETAVDTAALQQQDRAQLVDLADRASLVVLGNVIATRPDAQTANQAQIVTLFIEEKLRGEAVGMVEFSVPLVYVAGEARPPVIEGYKLLVFLNSSNSLLDGTGLYYIEADHAWRNRRDEVFLRPSADRDWTNGIDPLVDYTVLPLAEVRSAVAGKPGRARNTDKEQKERCGLFGWRCRD